VAILKVPRIATALRENLLLEEAEIVFDTDLKKFFGGDGVTLGGIEFFTPTLILTENGHALITEDNNILEPE
jgi:hypothetical protein